MPRCAWCRKELAEAQARHVPEWVRIPASIAMAFMHAGLWAQEELSRAYCPRCRARTIALALGFTAVILALAAAGAAIWLRGPR